MTVTVASFRVDFPEFASTTTYPDATVSFWLNASAMLLSADRWGDLLDLGTELFMAHNLALAAKDTISASRGGVPGTSTGIVSAKSVGAVSTSYDVASVALDKGGAWNLTSYGIRYLQLARLIGPGGVQL